MKIHEFQAKQIFRAAGVPVPRSIVAKTPAEAAQAFRDLGKPISVVKAQIHAGGRGKGTVKTNAQQRGVQLVKSAEESAAVAENLLGKELVTIQTGPAGTTVRQVLVEEGCDIGRELYLGIVVDRAAKSPVLICSAQGGVNIEEVAEKTPEAIFTEAFDPDRGLQSFQVRKMCQALEITGPTARQADKFFKDICRLFVAQDASLVEINPLVITKSGELLALDGKMTFDENADFRQPGHAELRDLAEEDPFEIRAGEAGLSYVKLNGNIGCLVNGAGLAMSTMDLIKLHGGEPANFLDVGGGANVEQVTKAFEILLSDQDVRGVLVNIFGGIMRCTTIATAIVAAYQTVGFNVPLVVRLEGTEVEQGRKILADSGFPIISAVGLTDAAQKIVAAVKQAK
ncbi:MAG: ADP-forming succinate--CoA ligase subunit beta [Pirellulales bacterium]|nr:ADP-forming succinate--CoA ligase subunit beta [Pirellulales bacterium]